MRQRVERIRVWARTQGHPLAAASLIALVVEGTMLLLPFALPGMYFGPCTASLPLLIWLTVWGILHFPAVVVGIVVMAVLPSSLDWLGMIAILAMSVGLTTMLVQSWIADALPWRRRRARREVRCAF